MSHTDTLSVRYRNRYKLSIPTVTVPLYFSSSRLATSECPPRRAISSAVPSSQNEPLTVMSQCGYDVRTLTASTFPLKAAACKGVKPPLSVKFIKAPQSSISVLTVSALVSSTSVLWAVRTLLCETSCFSRKPNEAVLNQNCW